jgi:hypothetical protein
LGFSPQLALTSADYDNVNNHDNLSMVNDLVNNTNDNDDDDDEFPMLDISEQEMTHLSLVNMRITIVNYN